MRRLFYKGILKDTIEIKGTDAHHLLHVLRAKAGQELLVVDDENRTARMQMTDFASDAVTLKLVEVLELDTEPPIEISLAQCLLKSDKMDFVVQKAVELGVKRILPIKSRNCVVRYDDKKKESRRQRWQRVADEAAKQCGRSALAEVFGIVELAEFLAGLAPTDDMELLFCYENEVQRSMKEYLRQSSARRICLLIGPEGGFTPEEAELVERTGGASVTMGPRILRAETAALAAISAVQYEKGDLG